MAMNQASIADILDLAVRLGADPIRVAEVLRRGSASSTALTLLPLNSAVNLDAPEITSPLGYLILDMELFRTAMTEAGIDADSIAARGLSGANRLLDVLRTLNPRPKQQFPS
jgi:3-hydroxyisobutyrate dehydrogenase-like beta-hydroxyacid dehydrogenase